ncbi:uncharacterized protein LOC100215474 [Hydra vulgaris]|uniref:uncharacterized protein LOC100215474 n=1 Tax=Hydra vulgaris TaxID=6087 RepID=UPI000192618B|nr:uncharacterized protein LOC100215474 [Hydra vulgaris]
MLVRKHMKIFELLLFMILIEIISSEDEVPPKECYENKEIQDVTRLFSKQDIPTSSASDINLEMGWYRIMGDAGNSLKQGFDKFLATGSSPPNFCGTELAGTLMEEHPTKEEGIVEMTVCFRARYCFFSNIQFCLCQGKQIIYVRNCGKHFVYWLFPTGEKMRYCTGSMGMMGAPIKSGKSTAVECTEYKLEESSSRIWDKVSDVVCDTEVGWVRFSAESGAEIASKCTKNTNPITRFGQSCGAEFRGWIMDRHPSLEEGRVQRRVCFSYADQCSCEFFSNIYVRNCGGFYVYRFNKVPICNARYCGAPSNSLSNVNDPSKPVIIKSKDLCSVRYNILHDPDRLWSFTSPTVSKCDAHLYGKYRFGSKYTPWTIIEGCNSSDSAIVTHRCGSEYQGYMIGKHPTRKGELVQRVICFQTPKIACQCQHTVSIDVQNCGDFFVYDFKSVPYCNSRFCMVANKSKAITIDVDRPPLYEIPPHGYNPVAIKQEQKKDNSLASTTTVLSIIIFIIIILLILLVLFILYMIWPVYKRRRDEKFYSTAEEPKPSSSNGVFFRDSKDKKDKTVVNSIPPFPNEPPPRKPVSDHDSEIEMVRGPDDDLQTIPEGKELDDSTDEYHMLMKKEDYKKPSSYNNFDTEI